MKAPRLVIAALFTFFAVGAARAQVSPVPGTANPWLALSGATDAVDSQPDESPIRGDTFALVGGQALKFTASGLVDLSGGTPQDGPDGADAYVVTHPPQNGLSGVTAPADALMGVFVNASSSITDTPPPSLDFFDSASVPGQRNYTSLAPQLGQVFFIGTGTTTFGTVKQVTVPDGATALFFGTMDGTGWYNNTGQFNVGVSLANSANTLTPTTFLVNGSNAPSKAFPGPAVVIAPGTALTFNATQGAPTTSGVYVRVQETTSPDLEYSWIDIIETANGHFGQMHYDGNGNYSLTTAKYQGGGILYFRAISAAPGYADDTISDYVGPFDNTGMTQPTPTPTPTPTPPPVTGIAVPGTANVWLAGKPAGTTARGGDSAPAQSPVEVTGFPFDPNASMIFTVAGGVGNGGGTTNTTPDGDAAFTTHLAENGINELNAPVNSLIGVFLDESGVAPRGGSFNYSGGRVPYLGVNAAGVRPPLGVPFFIGDGRGISKNFPGPLQVYPPEGATHLYLGALDQAGNNDNTGGFQVSLAAGPYRQSDISFSQTVNQTTALRGDVVTYTLKLVNHSQERITNVVVNDSVPAYTTLLDGAGNPIGGNLPLTTAIEPGEASPTYLTFSARVNPDAIINVFLVNDSITIYADNYGLLEPQKSSPRIPIKGVVDVAVSSDAATVSPGGLVTYSVTVTSTAVGKVKNVNVLIPKPAVGTVTGGYFTTDKGKQTDATDAGSNLNFAVGKLKFGETVTLTITVRVPFDYSQGGKVDLPGPQVDLTDDAKNSVSYTYALTEINLEGPAIANPPHFALRKLVPDAQTIKSLAMDKKGAAALKALYPGINFDADLSDLGRVVNPDIVQTTDDSGHPIQGVKAPGQLKGPAITRVTFALVYNNEGGESLDDVVITDQLPAGTQFIAKSDADSGDVAPTLKGKAFKSPNKFKLAKDGTTLTFSVGKVAAGTPEKPSFGIILYSVRVLGAGAGGVSLGAPIIASGAKIETPGLGATTYGSPEETRTYVTAPNGAYIESYQGQPAVAVAELTYFDIFYQNTGGKAAKDFVIVDAAPKNSTLTRADFLDDNHNERQPASEDEFIAYPGNQTAEFHLGKVKRGEHGWVRISVTPTDDALNSKDGYVIVNTPYVPASVFPDNPQTQAQLRSPQTRDDTTNLAAALASAQSITSVLYDIGRKTLNNGLPVPIISVGAVAPMVVSPGATFEYIVFAANTTSGPLASGFLSVALPPGVEYVSASLPDAQLVNSGADRAVVFPLHTGDLYYLPPPHGVVAHKITLRAPSNPKGGAMLSAGVTFFQGVALSVTTEPGFPAPIIDLAVLAPSYSPAFSTYALGQGQSITDASPQVFTTEAAALGQGLPGAIDAAALRALTGSLTFQSTVNAVGGADCIHLPNNVTIVPLGGGSQAVPGNVLALGRKDNIVAPGPQALVNTNGSNIVAQGGGNLISQDGNNIVAQGGGNLLATVHLIGQDGNNLVSAAGGTLQAIIANIVAQGGGNIVAQGGLNVDNIVAQGGGNIVAQGGLNLVSPTRTDVISNDGGTLTRIGPGLQSRIVSGGGGNLVNTNGSNIVAQGGLNFASLAGDIANLKAGSFAAVGGGALLGGGNVPALSTINSGLVSFAGGGAALAGGGRAASQAPGSTLLTRLAREKRPLR